ncbi:hypothetical protein TRE132_56660 [Pseudomonas chlororaphis subsp. aurantiaca]|nr:hypothetical protein TRE132_56660 [Pseudomonas chlororaphis subsp. aurantiaca]
MYDGNGHLVRDSFLEFWQANHEGVYDPVFDSEKAFNSFGRTATTFDAGEWALHTVKPGVVNNAAGVPMAPHINVALFARGINIHLHTRLYFADEPEANAACPVLNLIEQPQRRDTLLAHPCEVDGQRAYRFDIRIQGKGRRCSSISDPPSATALPGRSGLPRRQVCVSCGADRSLAGLGSGYKGCVLPVAAGVACDKVRRTFKRSQVCVSCAADRSLAGLGSGYKGYVLPVAAGAACDKARRAFKRSEVCVSCGAASRGSAAATGIHASCSRWRSLR